MTRAGRSLGVLLAALTTAAPGALARGAAQEPVPAPAATAQPPVFEVAVDVVAVDVSVVDPQGRPMLALAPEDFTVQVDGRPRQVVSAQYVGRDVEPVAQRPRPAAHYSTNEGATVGRLVLLLVDRGNIGRGGVRRVQDAADRFLSTLAPADRVGLAIIPGPAPGVEFTSDHGQVRQALKKVVGLADRSASRVPVADAKAFIERTDTFRWEQFVAVECKDDTSGKGELCPQELENEATQVYQRYQERARMGLAGLRAVFEGLRGVEGPKTVVLVSEGLGGEMRAELQDLARTAAEAQVTLFVLLLDTPGMDISSQRSTQTTQENRDLETGSIYDLASLARGTVLRVSGAADQPFERIGRELMGYYLLGFAPEPGDRDGKSHKVAVRVARDKATVRARGVLTIPLTLPGPQQLLAAALRSPFVEPGLVLKVDTYMRPAPGGKVKLLLAAEVERASRPVSVAYALLAADGKVVVSRLVQGIEEGDAAHVPFASEAIVEPGSYTLRLAAVDAAGRRGSVHHETKAVIQSAGGLQVSDLVLAPVAAKGGAGTPAVDLEVDAAGLVALLELASPDAGQLTGASAALEVADSVEGQSLVRVPLEAGPASAEGIRVAHATVGAGILPPGDYVARVSVSMGGKPVAERTRPFRIAAPRAGAPSARVPLAGLLTETRPYERSDLLKPGVLAYFLDRTTEIVQGPPPEGVAAAIEEARQGHPEAMLGRLSGATKEDVRVAFLRGVAYYAVGNLNASLTQLHAALGTRSDFFPAAVYMGGCYAAGGKDQDAIGAWQTALIGETGSPAVYAVLSDALLRTKDAGEAVGILDEGLAAFPDDPELKRRLGLAHAMAGHDEQALTLLTAWVDAHPEDTRALFATLALLFEGFSRDAAGQAKAEEQQRLRHYAKAYIDSNGPNRAVVERWLRYLESRPGG